MQAKITRQYVTMKHIFEMKNTLLFGTPRANTVRVFLELCDPTVQGLRPHVVLRRCVKTVSFYVRHPNVCVGRWSLFSKNNCGRITDGLFYFDVPFDHLLPHAPDASLFIHTSIDCGAHVLQDTIPDVLQVIIADLCGCCRIQTAKQILSHSRTKICPRPGVGLRTGIESC